MFFMFFYIAVTFCPGWLGVLSDFNMVSCVHVLVCRLMCACTCVYECDTVTPRLKIVLFECIYLIVRYNIVIVLAIDLVSWCVILGYILY